MIPVNDAEKDFYAAKFHDDLVAKAKAAFNFKESEPITKADLRKRYRQILLRIHPDKNGGEKHPFLHTIMCCFLLLLSHVEGRADEIELSEIQALTEEALEQK